MKLVYQGHIALAMCILSPKECSLEHAFYCLENDIPLMDTSRKKFRTTRWISDELKDEIYGYYLKGISQRQIGLFMGIPSRTINVIVKKRKKVMPK